MAKILTVTLNPALDLTVRLAHLEIGQVNRCEALISHAAGKGLNVAQVLADLGHTVTVAGFLGADNQQAFEALFAKRGFVDEFVRVAGETRSNIKLAESSGRISDFNGPGPHVSLAAQEALFARLIAIAPEHELLVLAGSLPLGVEPQWLGRLLQQLQRLQVRVALDTSGAALREGLLAAPWLIKPNTEELADAVDTPVVSLAAQAQVARQLHGRGIEHVVISQGAEGVHWFGPNIAWLAVPPKVAVASTVGAGDALLAGMLHGLLSGWSAERTLRNATAIAALVVTQIGGGISDKAQLARLASAISVRPLSE